MNDPQHECAVAAALILLDELDANPDMPKHELFALLVFSIKHAIEKFAEETGDGRAVEFSAN